MVDTARTRHGSRTGRRLVIGLLVLVVLLIGVDRIGDYAAEVAAGNTIAQSQNLDSRPDVDIGGFPFLTQLAAKDFDQITVTANDVPVPKDDKRVTLDRIRVVLDHLTVSRDFQTVHAETANAKATLGYDELSSLVGVDVRYAGDGRLEATKKITILGRTITPTITVAPELTDGALSFGAAQINDAGGLADQVGKILNKAFDVQLPLQGIPFELRVQKISAGAAGIDIALAGADLTYRRQG